MQPRSLRMQAILNWGMLKLRPVHAKKNALFIWQRVFLNLLKPAIIA
jgi:hypothetical protein